VVLKTEGAKVSRDVAATRQDFEVMTAMMWLGKNVQRKTQKKRTKMRKKMRRKRQIEQEKLIVMMKTVLTCGFSVAPCVRWDADG